MTTDNTAELLKRAESMKAMGYISARAMVDELATTVSALTTQLAEAKAELEGGTSEGDKGLRRLYAEAVTVGRYWQDSARSLTSQVADAKADTLEAAAADIELPLPWDHHGNTGENAIQYNAEAQASVWLETRASAIRAEGLGVEG